MSEIDPERLFRVVIGAVIATSALQNHGLALADAKIALRTAAFMLDELYRHQGLSLEEIQKLNTELSPHIMEFIKAEIEMAG